MNSSDDTETEKRGSIARSPTPCLPHLFVVLAGDAPLVGGGRCSLAAIDEAIFSRSELLSMHRSRTRLNVGLPDRSASSLHARLFFRDAHWWLEDAKSTNGTFVNGVRISGRRLDDGDILEMGRTVLRVRSALPTPAGTPDVAHGHDACSGPLEAKTLLPMCIAEHKLLGFAAETSMPILLLGETGTGKEVMARAIHAASKRRGDLMAVNCAAVPQTLIEAHFFGHVRGAFSGAGTDALGYVRAAHGGTLFLDEIGDLAPAAQGALLRVLQEGEVVPVGSTRPVSVDVRVVAATHQPLDAMVERGTFRKDLYARLQGFTHRLYPLRTRREDIGLLTAELLRLDSQSSSENIRISGEAAYAIVRYDWPLNVRELRQALARACAMCANGRLELEHFPPAIMGRSPRPAVSQKLDGLSPTDIGLYEKLTAVLREKQGNVAAAARDMQKSPVQLYRWIGRFGIDVKKYRS